MTIKVTDLDQVEAWSGGAILPPGRHRVKIEAATEGTSSGGHPQVELEFANGTGAIRDWLVFTEATLGKARRLLDAVGIEPEPGEWEFPTSRLAEKVLVIQVGDEPDNRNPAETRRRVFAYLPATETAVGDSGPGSASDMPADKSDLPF